MSRSPSTRTTVASPWAEGSTLYLEVAGSCHRRECRGRRTGRALPRMSDRISLTIPARTHYTAVATLVLGGIGSRLDLPYERMDDLQLAVLSVLESGGDGEITVEVDAAAERFCVSLGPLAAGTRATRA